MHSTDIQWSAILSWGYADNILRLKSKQSEPPINFIQCSQLHQVGAHNLLPGIDLDWDVARLQSGFMCLSCLKKGGGGSLDIVEVLFNYAKDFFF